MDELIAFLYSPSGIGGLSTGAVLLIALLYYWIYQERKKNREEDERKEKQKEKRREMRLRKKLEAEANARAQANINVNIISTEIGANVRKYGVFANLKNSIL